MTELLLKQGLMNDGLVTLTPLQIERLNRCHERAGIPKTKRKKVRVDCIGWSPEIASELGDPLYLARDVINPIAIILDPAQYRKPVFAPAFSWIRDAVDLFWKTNHKEIFDVLVSHAILLDLDNGLSGISGPCDLQLLTEIIARPDTGTLSKGADEQAALLDKFKGLKCLDHDLQEEIMRSRKEVGDLRKRRVQLKPMPFNQFQDFYTIACKGAAVFRNVNGEDLLVLEDEKTYESVRDRDCQYGRITYLYDEEGEPFRLLHAAGWLDIPVEIFRQDHRHLERMKDILLGMLLSDVDGDETWSSMSLPKRRSLLKKEGNEEKARLYFELERYAAAIKRGDGQLPDVSHELWYYLLAPTDKVPPSTREVLMILLTRKEPRRLLDLYTSDKNRFFVEYKTWPKHKKQWAAEFVASHYEKRMNKR